MKMMKKYTTIEEYISAFPTKTQLILKKMHQTIKQAAPNAVEAISYGIPTFKLHGNLVHFGGYDTHIGFYPGAEAVEVFKKELAAYDLSKGTVRFSLDKTVPYDLVAKITQYRVKKNSEKKK
jgi:uncharacterized protein YdhG (YjbR/CyaY superfamily)